MENTGYGVVQLKGVGTLVSVFCSEINCYVQGMYLVFKFLQQEIAHTNEVLF